MTEAEIFEKYIKKVKKGGYIIDLGEMPVDVAIQFKVYYKFLFNLDSAKAFWGDLWLNKLTLAPLILKMTKQKKKIAVSMESYDPAYLLHLSLMAREREPLRYIEKFL